MIEVLLVASNGALFVVTLVEAHRRLPAAKKHWLRELVGFGRRIEADVKADIDLVEACKRRAEVE